MAEVRKTVLVTRRINAGSFIAIMFLQSCTLTAAAKPSNIHLRDFSASKSSPVVLDLPGRATTPDELLLTVNRKGAIETLHLRRNSVRARNYQLIVYHNGAYRTVTPSAVCTYTGFVEEEAESRVAAMLDDDGLTATVIGGPDGSWSLHPRRAIDSSAPRSEHLLIEDVDKQGPEGTCGLESAASPGNADSLLPLDLQNNVGNIGIEAEVLTLDAQSEEFPVDTMALDPTCTVRQAQIAFDMDNAVYLTYGNLTAAQNRIDQIVNELSLIYSRDALISYTLTGTIIRQSEFYDYEINNEAVSLDEFRNKWESGAAGNGAFTYDFAHLVTGNNSGVTLGVAYVNAACGSLRYGFSVDTVGVMAHEIGHNWGLGHCDGDGDCHIMCSGFGGCDGNPTFFGDTKALTLLDQAYNFGCIADAPSPYGTTLPPRALQDVQWVKLNDTVSFDPLGNDHDGNCDVVSLQSFDSASDYGSVVTLSAGDQLLYTAPSFYASGTDRAAYTIEDGNGNSGSSHVVALLGLPDSLIGYWPMDEGVSGNMDDVSIYDHEGSPVDVTQGVAGQFGNAILFNQATSRVDINGFADRVLDGLTISVWINATDWNGNRRIVQKGGDGEDFRLLAEFGNFVFEIENSRLEIPTLPPTGQWVHITAKYNGSEMRVFYDGVLQGVLAKSGSWTLDTSTLYVGTKNAGSIATDRFLGSIDELRIYDRVLSFSEIQEQISGVPAEHPYPCDGAGDVLLDMLSWAPGSGTTSSRVYLGDSATAVADADTASPEYKGAQAAAAYVIGDISPARTYYWRIDSVTPGGTITGPVWSFTTSGDLVNVSNLDAYWTFDEAQYRTVFDYAGGEAHGLTVRNPSWNVSDKKIGISSLRLDNTLRQCVEVPDAPGLNPTSAMTLALWIKATDWNGNRRLLQKSGDSSQYRLLVENGAMKFQIGVTELSYVTRPATGQWVHVAATYDGATMRLYYNGVLKATQSRTGAIPTTTDPLFIGAKDKNVTVLGDYFYGLVDDFRIYHVALSATQITQLMTPPANPQGLTAAAGDGLVDLDWADNAEADLDGYSVYRSETSGGPYAPIAIGIAASTYTDDTAVNCVPYYYVVTATDVASNESGYSNQDSATAAPTPGDIDGDGNVSLIDFGYLSAQWSTDGSAIPSADIAPTCGDGVVNMQDLLAIVLNFLESN